jgi:formylglycine-generating enzyme required for sulfatase activity
VQEEIPQEQRCYEIKGEVIQLKENYLSLTGYRLPTEAEMEYATRAGASTSRYYGETEELLPKYAWYQKNAQGQSWPVGSLKPNDLGLFDLHGNAFTWCQETYQSYPTVNDDSFLEDKEDVSSIAPTDNRVLRGGSFGGVASFVRSACRNLVVPTFSSYTFGFRLARSVTP